MDYEYCVTNIISVAQQLSGERTEPHDQQVPVKYNNNKKKKTIYKAQ